MRMPEEEFEFPTSDKQSSFGRPPHIKKGYYPAKFVDIKKFADKDGNLKMGKFGTQIIMSFAIYEYDQKTGAPTVPMKVPVSPDMPAVTEDVVIGKFVYFQYKDKSGQLQTAVTPNSAITGILKALGWEFDPKSVKIKELIGRWVEVNVDDWTREDKQTGETYKTSTIAKISKYEGPPVKDVPEANVRKPADVQKQLKHEALAEDAKAFMPDEKDSPEVKTIKEQAQKLQDLKSMISEQAYKDGMEQIEAQLKKVSK